MHRSSQRTKSIWIVVGLLTILFSSTYLIDTWRSIMETHEKTLSWTKTEGTLLEASLWLEYTPQLSEEENYELNNKLTYAYAASNSEGEITYHRSKRFDSFASESDRKFPWTRLLAERGMINYARRDLPAVTVFYNPEDPAESIIWKSVPLEAIHAVTFAAALLFPILYLLIIAPKRVASEKGTAHSNTEIFSAQTIACLLFAGAYSIAVQVFAPMIEPHHSVDFLMWVYPSVLGVALIGIKLFDNGLRSLSYPLSSLSSLAMGIILIAGVGVCKRDLSNGTQKNTNHL